MRIQNILLRNPERLGYSEGRTLSMNDHTEQLFEQYADMFA